MTDCAMSNWLIQFASDYEKVIDAIGVILIPLAVGGGLFYVALQQHKTNRQRLVFEQYDRRLKLYNAVRSFLGEVMRTGKASPHMGGLVESLSESHFLFGEEIAEYLKELWSKACALDLAIGMLTDRGTKGNERKRYAKEKSDLLGYFTEQNEVAREKFKKYLQLK